MQLQEMTGQTRRRFILAGGAMILSRAALAGDGGGFPQTEGQWRARLTGWEYRILREGYNETAGTSPLARETRRGRYACKGCRLDVFDSGTKIQGATGWPRFTAPLPGRVFTRRNGRFFGIGMVVGCRRCASHLGIVDRGTYRMNGLALVFEPG